MGPRDLASDDVITRRKLDNHWGEFATLFHLLITVITPFSTVPFYYVLFHSSTWLFVCLCVSVCVSPFVTLSPFLSVGNLCPAASHVEYVMTVERSIRTFGG